MSATADALQRRQVPSSGPLSILQIILIALVAIGVSLTAGLVAVKLGNASNEETSSFYLVGIAAAGLAAVFGLMRARQPRRACVVALLLLFPYIARYLPPGRLGLSTFDVLVLLVVLSTVARNFWRPAHEKFSFFPVASLAAVHLLMLPTVALSEFPVTSLISYVETFLYYAFFLFLVEMIRQPDGYEKVLRLMAIATALIAVGVAIEALTGFNVAFAAKNRNSVNPAATGRYSGFFLDPQTAGDFLACYVALVVTLLFRGRLRGLTRILSVVGLIAGVLGLVATGSRSALGAAVVASTLVLFLLNRWPIAIKLALGTMAGAIGLAALFFGHDLASLVLPESVIRRFLNSGDDFQFRLGIWRSTWSIFEEHPIFGIGPNSFQQYMVRTRPVSTWLGTGSGGSSIYAVLTHPESGYLYVLYSSGVLGVLACGTLFIATLLRAIRVVRFGNDDARTDALAGLACMVVFLMTFFTVYMIPDERNTVIVLLGLALIWARSFDLPKQGVRAKSRRIG